MNAYKNRLFSENHEFTQKKMFKKSTVKDTYYFSFQWNYNYFV